MCLYIFLVNKLIVASEWDLIRNEIIWDMPALCSILYFLMFLHNFSFYIFVESFF